MRVEQHKALVQRLDGAAQNALAFSRSALCTYQLGHVHARASEHDASALGVAFDHAPPVLHPNHVAVFVQRTHRQVVVLGVTPPMPEQCLLCLVKVIRMGCAGQNFPGAGIQFFGFITQHPGKHGVEHAFPCLQVPFPSARTGAFDDVVEPQGIGFGTDLGLFQRRHVDVGAVHDQGLAI